MYVIIQQFYVKPEHRLRFITTMITMGQGPREAMPGIIRCDVIQDGADPNCFFLYGVYTNRAAFYAHIQRPQFKSCAARIRDWLSAQPTYIAQGIHLSP